MILKQYKVWNNEDNLPTHRDLFATYKEAEEFKEKFRARFEQQGYYSNNRRQQIALEDLDLEIIEKQVDLREYVTQEVKYNVNEIFEQAHFFALTNEGDITVEQKLKLEKIQADLTNLIIEQVKQNLKS